MQVSAMRKDINLLVNFEHLKKCNDICFKWSKHFKIKKSNYAQFMWKTFRNPEIICQKLNSKHKSKFMKDCKTMFYAAEVEEILIKQYSPMIINIMKRLHINYEKFEDYLSYGYMAIRSAVWQYRTYKIKASFTTYAHRAIFMRIRGILHREKTKILDRKIRISCESDYESKEFDLESVYLHKDCAANMEDLDSQILNISKECSLSQQETMLLISFANRKIDAPVWYEEYRKKYINTKLNKQFSRQSIYNHLAAIHEKVLFYLQQKNIAPEGYAIPQTRRGDFR